jgi:fibrillarin-like rRNA methylase
MEGAQFRLRIAGTAIVECGSRREWEGELGELYAVELPAETRQELLKAASRRPNKWVWL